MESGRREPSELRAPRETERVQTERRQALFRVRAVGIPGTFVRVAPASTGYFERTRDRSDVRRLVGQNLRRHPIHVDGEQPVRTVRAVTRDGPSGELLGVLAPRQVVRSDRRRLLFPERSADRRAESCTSIALYYYYYYCSLCALYNSATCTVNVKARVNGHTSALVPPGVVVRVRHCPDVLRAAVQQRRRRRTALRRRRQRNRRAQAVRLELCLRLTI